MINYKAQGKKNKIKGAKFEKKVREHFESEDWIITKYQNNVDLETKEIIHAKNHYIPRRGCTLGSGFPDFLMFKNKGIYFELMLVECKTNGYLSKEEKEKCKFLVDEEIPVYIAYIDKSSDIGFRLRKFEWEEGKKETIPRGQDEY